MSHIVLHDDIIYSTIEYKRLQNLKNTYRNMKKHSYSHSDYQCVARGFESDVKSTPNFKNHPSFFKGKAAKMESKKSKSIK